MKKIILLFIISFIFVSCGSYKSLDLGKLTTGMTKAEVRYLIGPPDRILAVNDKPEGFQEVLEYRTSRSEVYALEFWNDYLTGYEYLYDDISYTPALLPPAVYPPHGRPIYIINNNRPNRPNRPSQPESPSRPGTPRPEPSRPGNTTGTTRPTTRPGNTTGSSNSTRPTTRPSTSSSTDRSSGSDSGTRDTSAGRSSGTSR